MSEEGTSERKHIMNNNITPGTTENAISGKTKICKKFKKINSHEKYASIYIKHRQYKKDDKLWNTCCK